MEKYLYDNEKIANIVAKKIGCEGCHKHGKKFMPCKTHKEFEKLVNTEELGEFVNADGSWQDSKINKSEINPNITSKSTTDQVVKRTKITQDPLARGFRVYYENKKEVSEVDMSDAYGYEETKEMNAEETIDYFINVLGMDEFKAVDRAKEFGKDVDLTDDSEHKKEKDFIDKSRLNEKNIMTKEEFTQLVDSLVKKTDKNELVDSDDNSEDKDECLKICLEIEKEDGKASKLCDFIMSNKSKLSKILDNSDKFSKFL